MNKTGSNTPRLWRATSIGSIQKHTSNKIILDTISNRRPQTGSRNSKKRILTKEKLDKQLTGQSSTSPFMTIRNGTERKVSFNARDELGDRIDKLTVVMSRLAAKDSYEKRPFKPLIYKSRGQNRSYIQRGYQKRSGRSDCRNKGQYGNNRPRQNHRDNNFEGTPEDMEDRIIEENIEIIGTMNITKVGMGQEKGYSQGIMVTIEIEVPVTVDQGQDLELALREIG